MSWKGSLLVLGLLAASLPSSLASAASLGSVGGVTAAPERIAHTVASDAKKAAALKKKQQQAALKKKQQQEAAAKAAAAKKEQEKKEWYEDDRDRGLDVAEKYAPDQIKRVKKNNYIAKGDTVSTGEGKKGWQHYMDKYYKR
ncbi:MAG: hypothetical protein AB7S70_08515 [Hyphomicrobium sp.]|uniref:hypothetical protein n=1 Tax=Hyphomicrobium sp. TaxID=82 RepID=UPI003D100B25